jgi:hypothetical protein
MQYLCEHLFVTFADALLLLYELADKQDKRYQAAAARWHARFVLEARLPLGESAMAMELLRGITGSQLASGCETARDRRGFRSVVAREALSRGRRRLVGAGVSRQ